MDLLNSDNIIAEMTPTGRGGVSAIRISGPDSNFIVSSFFDKNIKKERYAYYFSHEVDDFVVLYYKAPKSYTGEDVCEIFCHANPALVDSVINLFISKNKNKLRLAKPGEFTKKAYLNGKIDLVQAEAVVDIINASSADMAKQKTRMLKGLFSQKIKTIKDQLVDMASVCETHIDFSEDDPGIFDYESNLKKIKDIRESVVRFIDSCALIKDVSDSVRVVITGNPNVGKSSLFNKFVEYERAIVHHSPGTTRDYIEEYFVLDGIEVCFVDTAGLRKDPESEIEQEGIRRVLDIINSASIIIEISDNGLFSHTDSNVIKVQNKIDLLPLSNLNKQKGVFYVSIKTGEGLDELRQYVFSLINQNYKMSIHSTSAFSVNTRQISYLTNLKESIQKLEKGLFDNEPLDVVSFLLRENIAIVNGVLGEGVVSEDILNSVFSKFCIGK